MNGDDLMIQVYRHDKSAPQGQTTPLNGLDVVPRLWEATHTFSDDVSAVRTLIKNSGKEPVQIIIGDPRITNTMPTTDAGATPEE